MTERLVECAILRDGKVHSGHRVHWMIRDDLGDDNPTRDLPGDESGYLTSTGRFVTRAEAVSVGLVARQVPFRFQFQPPERLLSSQIEWDAK